MFEEKRVRPRVTSAIASIHSIGGESVLLPMHMMGHLRDGMTLTSPRMTLTK